MDRKRDSRKDSDSSNKSRWSFGILELFFSGCIVIFTGVLTWTAIGQWNISQLQWQTMEKTLKLSERPWVGIKDFNNAVIEVGKKIAMGATIVNYGKSPALNVKTLSIFYVGPRGVDADRVLADNQDESAESLSDTGVLFSGDAKYKINFEDSRPLTEAQMLEVMSERKTIYLIGEIKYTDTFDDSHLTRFCYIFLVSLKSFHSCNHGNMAD